MSAWVSSTWAQIRPRASKASSYRRISRLWPAAAAACLSAISRGRAGSRRRSTPRATAPLDTSTGKRAPLPATAATSSQRAENRSRSSVGAPACPPRPASTAEPILITGRRVWASWVRGLCVIGSASAHPYDSKAPDSVQGRDLLRTQADGLDVVAVGVEDERRVVRLAVARPRARFSVVFTAGRERRRVEALDGCAVLGLEGQVERARGPAGPEPELRGARPAEPGGSGLRVVGLEAVSERLQGGAIEAQAPGEIRHRQSDVVEHGFLRGWRPPGIAPRHAAPVPGRGAPAPGCAAAPDHLAAGHRSRAGGRVRRSLQLHPHLPPRGRPVAARVPAARRSRPRAARLRTLSPAWAACTC